MRENSHYSNCFNKLNFKAKPKRDSIIGSVPLFKTGSESQTNVSPTPS